MPKAKPLFYKPHQTSRLCQFINKISSAFSGPVAVPAKDDNLQYLEPKTDTERALWDLCVAVAKQNEYRFEFLTNDNIEDDLSTVGAINLFPTDFTPAEVARCLTTGRNAIGRDAICGPVSACLFANVRGKRIRLDSECVITYEDNILAGATGVEFRFMMPKLGERTDQDKIVLISIYGDTVSGKAWEAKKRVIPVETSPLQ